MRHWRIMLVLLLLPLLIYAPAPTCATCSELANALQSGVFALVHDTPGNQTLEVVAYYENDSATPSRQPLNDTIVLIELSNSTNLYQVYKAYTNDQGIAYFNFNQWNTSCINFKAVYCPFCIPPDSACTGFQQCLNFSHIQTTATNASGIPDAPDAVVPTTLNPNHYLPELATADWCPPPPPLDATPALCLPLILIFALLSGSLYLSGKNPFAGFNIGGQRIGQHIRYQARGRGYQVSITQIASAVASVAGSAAKGAKMGGKAFVKSEVRAANQSGLIGSVTQARSALSDSRKMAAAMPAAQRGAHGGAAPVVTAGGARTSVAPTAGGMLAGSGGVGIRPGSLISPGFGGTGAMHALGVVAGTMGRVVTLILLNTIIGSAISGAYQQATGQSLFDAFFANHRQQLHENLNNLNAALNNADLKKANIGDIPVTVVSKTVNDNGTSTVVIEVPNRGTKAGDIPNGQMTLTFNPEGKVVGASFQAAGAVQPTRDNPAGTASVVATFDAKGNPSFYVDQQPARGQRQVDAAHPDQSGFLQLPPESLNYANAFSAYSNSPPGMNQASYSDEAGSKFLTAYNDKMEGVHLLAQQVGTELSYEKNTLNGKLDDLLGQNPPLRQAFEAIKTQEVDQLRAQLVAEKASPSETADRMTSLTQSQSAAEVFGRHPDMLLSNPPDGRPDAVGSTVRDQIVSTYGGSGQKLGPLVTEAVMITSMERNVNSLDSATGVVVNHETGDVKAVSGGSLQQAQYYGERINHEHGVFVGQEFVNMLDEKKGFPPGKVPGTFLTPAETFNAAYTADHMAELRQTELDNLKVSIDESTAAYKQALGAKAPQAKLQELYAADQLDRARYENVKADCQKYRDEYDRYFKAGTDYMNNKFPPAPKSEKPQVGDFGGPDEGNRPNDMPGRRPPRDDSRREERA